MLKYDVEIVGPTFGNGIWRPCDTNEMHYIGIPGLLYPRGYRMFQQLIKATTGAIIYALKPRPTSFGVGLIKKLGSNISLALDIDDWEVGFYLAQGRQARITDILRELRYPNAYLYTLLIEKIVKFADVITTSSDFLAEKFRGIKVPHGRDTNLFNPKRYRNWREDFRKKNGLQDKKVIMFLGTPRPHKGLEDLVDAVDVIQQRNLVIYIIGAGRENGYYWRKFHEKIKKKTLIIEPMISFNEIPFYLSVADLVVVPQRKSTATIGQVPAKLFDAMAMAKPIISTAVSDIPAILDNCGIVVPPGDVQQLANSIRRLVNDTRLCSELGSKARQKCIRNYSF